MARLEIKPRIVFKTAMGSPLGRVVLAGLLKQHAGVPEKPMRTLGNYAIVYLLKGSGTFTDAEGVHARLSPGDLLTVFPEVPHWYGPEKGSLWDEFYIVFSGAVFDLWRKAGLLRPNHPVRHLEPLDYWLRRLQEVVLAETDSLQQVCSLQHLLAEAIEASDEVREPAWISHARNLLQANQVSVSGVAHELGMTYETFRKRFAAAAGMPPASYQAMKRVERASAMIIAGGITNKEIAEVLGFCDEFHFSRRFKHILGLTPTQFRQKLPRPGA